MSKPFKTFIVILIVSAIVSTSGQQNENPTQSTPQDAETSTVIVGNSDTKGTNGTSGSSGSGGGGLISGIISLPITVVSFVLSPIKAVLSFVLGTVGNLLGTILNVPLSLLKTIFSPIFFVLGLPVDIVEGTLGGVTGGIGALGRGILSLVLSTLIELGATSTPAAIAGPSTVARVRRDLVRDSIMDVASYVSSIISPFLLNLYDSTQDAAFEILEWTFTWAKQVLLPRLDQFLVSAKDSPWITENMAEWFSDMHTTYTWLHMFGIL